VTDGIGHRQHGQAESKCDAEKSDPQRRKGGGKHSGSAAAEDQPQGAKKLGRGAARHVHGCPPASMRPSGLVSSSPSYCSAMIKKVHLRHAAQTAKTRNRRFVDRTMSSGNTRQNPRLT